jgi:hypothetical protein
VSPDHSPAVTLRGRPDAPPKTFGTLYSGIGGADLGLCLHKWTPVFQAECDVFRAQVLRKNFPDAKLYQSVEVAAEEIIPGDVEVVYTEMPDRDLRRWWPPAALAIEQACPDWAVVEFSPTADMSPILRWFALEGWGFRFFTVTARVYTETLTREEQDVRTRAVLVASQNPDVIEDTIKLQSTRVDMTAGGPPLKSPKGSTEMEEESRALPPGWTCACGVPEIPGHLTCTCNQDARRSAVRDATSPVIADFVAYLLLGVDPKV